MITRRGGKCCPIAFTDILTFNTKCAIKTDCRKLSVHSKSLVIATDFARIAVQCILGGKSRCHPHCRMERTRVWSGKYSFVRTHCQSSPEDKLQLHFRSIHFSVSPHMYCRNPLQIHHHIHTPLQSCYTLHSRKMYSLRKIKQSSDRFSSVTLTTQQLVLIKSSKECSIEVCRCVAGACNGPKSTRRSGGSGPQQFTITSQWIAI